MNIFTRLLSLTLTYQIGNLIKSVYDYIKESKTVGKILHSDDFNKILTKYLHIDFDEDWIGRVYGIINPLIDIDGKINFNNQIIEINGENTNNSEYVKSFLYKQLSLMNDLFKLNGIYDNIVMSVEHVGPVNGDNYLIVFDTVCRKNMAKVFKRVAIQSILYIMIIAIIFAIL